MPVSNSDIAAILRFVHKKGDNFIRTLTIEDNSEPRLPVDLTGHEAIFTIFTIKKSTSVFTVNSEDNPTNISITGTDNNKISINFPVNLDVSRYTYQLSIKDLSGNIKTWLRGDFIVN